MASATLLVISLAIASGVKPVSISNSSAGCLSFLRRFFFAGELSSSLSFLRFWGVTGGSSWLGVVIKALFALKEGVRFRPEVRGDFSDPVGDDGGWEFGVNSRSLKLSGGGAGGFPRGADAVDDFLVVPGGVRSTAIQRIRN
jgi:hypothetical protein